MLAPVNISRIKQFGGTVYYVDGTNGSNDNAGTSPRSALATIGAAIALCVKGDAISIFAATYTETGLDLNVDAVEMWIEIGTIIAPASGVGLVVSGNYCKIECPNGSLRINPTGAVGVSITGDFNYMNDVRVAANSSGTIGFDITSASSGSVLENCRCSNPATAAFKIAGDSAKLEDCCTGGNAATIGFWVAGTADKPRLKNCGSQGHTSSGFQVDTGSTNGAIDGCYSGGGDGRWSDADDSAVWSDFHYDNVKHKVMTCSGTTKYSLFKVIGAVKVKSIFGTVETVIAATASLLNLELYSTNATVDITDAVGAPDVNARVVGTVFSKQSVSTDPLLVGEPDTIPAIIEDTNYRDPNVPIVLVKDNGADTYLQAVLSVAVATGAIHWQVEWEPVSDDGFLEVV